MSTQKLILLPTGIAVNDTDNMVIHVDSSSVKVNQPLTVHADVKVQGSHFACVDENDNELLSVDEYSVNIHGPITVSSGLNIGNSGYLNVAVGDHANDENNGFITCTDASTGEQVLEVNASGSHFKKSVVVDSDLDVTGAVKFHGGDLEYDPVTKTLIVHNLIVKGSFSNSNTVANSFTVVSPEVEPLNETTTTEQ